MTATDPAGGVVALRTIGPVLIELPISVPPNHRPWAASIWPARDDTGWGREVWAYDPARRGWTIPVSYTHGTIVEIGVATISTRRRPALTHRAWYAVALAHDHHWLVCTTPFPGPADAHTRSRQSPTATASPSPTGTAPTSPQPEHGLTAVQETVRHARPTVPT